MMRGSARLAVAAGCAAVLTLACHRKSPEGGAGPVASAAPSSSTAAADAAPELAAPRCRTGPAELTLVDAGGEEADFGEAIPTPEGLAVGLTLGDGATRTASMALVAAGLARASVVPLGLTSQDAPPPRPFVVGKRLFAAAYVHAGADAGPPHTRPLVLFRLDGTTAARVAQIDQRSDDSPTVDVAAGAEDALLAWDEDAADHGVVRVARLVGGSKLVDAGIASPGTTDADEPQVVPRPNGYWLAWIARRPERTDAGETVVALSAGSDPERPSEDRAYRWVELQALDGGGQPVGTPHAITATQGHVSAFSLVSRDDGAHLFVRDDEEAFEGAGGRILHVAVHGDRAEAPEELVAQGVGPGAPTLLSVVAMPPLLVYADGTDQTRIVPLSPALALVGAASVEPALADARPLGAIVGRTGWVAGRAAKILAVACIF